MSRPISTVCAVLAFAIGPAGTFAGEPMIPDTLAGKHASALIAAFNTGDEATMSRFEIEHRAKSAARRRPLEERVARWSNLYADWGKLEVRNVLSSGEHDILVVVDPERAEGWVHLALELEEESPHGLDGIRIEGPVDSESSIASNKRLDDDRRKSLGRVNH